MRPYANSEDPDEMQHYMLHFIRVYTVCKVKNIFRQNTILCENYTLKLLDMYNGLSQVYCINPER